MFEYLREVIDAFNFLSVRFSLEYFTIVSRRKLLKDLRDLLFPAPLYRSLFSERSGQDVLCRVKKMPIPPCIKRFFFKLHTGTLPIKARMKECGIFVAYSIDCSLCKVPETIDHVFIYCWDAFLFWDVLKRTFNPLASMHVYIRFR